jgi:hypothetical protein
MIICNWKKFIITTVEFAMMASKIHYNPAALTFLTVICLVLKSQHMQNMLLRIESTGRCKHHKQVKVEYYYVKKEACN